MAGPRAAAAVLALLVVLAGCGGVGPLGEATDEPTEPVVTVEGGDLPFEPATVYRRVAELHGVAYTSLPDVTVTVSDRPDLNVTDLVATSRFQRLFGIRPEAPDTAVAGLAWPDRIKLFTEVVDSPAQLERVLAHEFAHVIQFDRGTFGTVDARIDGSGANESRLQTAVTEGAASYVASQYASEYLDASPTRPTWAEVRANRSHFGAYVLAPYHFGERYVHRRVDSPADLSAVYEDPPRTSEQLIHGSEDQPLDLQVTVETDRTVTDRRAQGELFVRLLLEGELDLDRAAEAAAGWGADELVVLDGENYAWALRWDTAEDAGEFATAMRDFLDRFAGDPGDGPWRTNGTAYDVRRAGDGTVVVFAGDPGFVEGATASADGETVTVTDGGSDPGVANGRSVRSVEDPRERQAPSLRR